MVTPVQPQYIQLYPTDRCNQVCYFCFNRGIRPIEDISFDNACRLINIMARHGIFDLDIMGGEPFLLKWMPDLIKKASSSGIFINISTNGSMTETYERLIDISPQWLNIGVSIEGSTAEIHNSITGTKNFDHAIIGIKQLIAFGLNPIVKTVFCRPAKDDILDIIKLLEKIGVKRFYLIHMDNLSHDMTADGDAPGFMEFMEFYQRITRDNKDINIDKVNASCFERQSLPKGSRCAAGIRKISVMPDGSVYPCNLLRHMPSYRLGNILTDELKSILKNPLLDFFRNFDKNRCEKISCRNHTSCTGGCPAHALFHGYDINGQDIRCR